MQPLFFIWIFLGGYSLYITKDLFSASKIYLVVFFVFFGEGFYKTYSHLSITLAIYMLLLFALVIIGVERRGLSMVYLKLESISDINHHLIKRIWLFSLVPLAAQLYLVSAMGGVQGYMLSIVTRVSDWQGYGVVLLLIKSINLLNYIYFIEIVSSKKNYRSIALFVLHFCLFSFIAIISGSRSMLLWNLVYMLIFYHYFIKPVSIPSAIMMAVLALSLAMFLGVVRDAYKGNTAPSIELSSAEDIFNTSNFSYGVFPIEVLIEQDTLLDIRWGSTYLTVFTNLIPRFMWPEKPDPGGVVLTKDFLGDPHSGKSNYTTGIIGEAFINYGYSVGVIISGVILSLIYCVFFWYVRYVKSRLYKSNISLLSLGVYPIVLFGTPGFLHAEFTNSTLTLFVFKIFLYIVLVFFLSLRFCEKYEQDNIYIKK